MVQLREVLDDPDSRVSKVFLVIDIVDSTEMKETDPEASWITTYALFFDTVNEVIADFDGVIVKYLGDGALIVFEEDDATDALNAAIELQETLKEKNRNNVLSVACSVGIAAGETREFEVPSGGIDYIGQTVDRAFRLCGAANAKAIFVDTNTTAAANMNRVDSEVGRILDRKTTDYIGPRQLVSVKGFSSAIKYYEIWWNTDRYGVSAGFVTGSARDEETAKQSASETESDVSEHDEKTSDADEWRVGWIKHWPEESDFGFISSEGEDFYFNERYFFLDSTNAEVGRKVCFIVKEPFEEGQNRRASRIFVKGQKVTGSVSNIVRDKGFGFAEVESKGEKHDLFFLIRELPELEVGNKIDCTIEPGDRGPKGQECRIVE